MTNENGARLLAHRWQTPDGVVLWSKHRHDFKGHTMEDGTFLAVDGGDQYIRLTNPQKLTDMCVYEDSEHVEKREVVSWGSYGKNGDEELHYILLKDMTTEHIEAVIRTQPQIRSWLFDTMCDELQYRRENNL